MMIPQVGPFGLIRVRNPGYLTIGWKNRGNRRPLRLGSEREEGMWIIVDKMLVKGNL